MTLKHKLTTTILAASLALTSATALGQRNSSETQYTPTPEVTRTERGGTRYSTGWTEGEWMYLDYRGGNVLMVAIDDQGSDAAAKRYQRTLMTDEAMEYAGLYPMGDFRVTGTDNCEGMRGDMDGMTTYVVICYEDSYTAMIIGNNRRDVIDMAQEVEMYGEPEAPRGYVED